MKFKDRNGRELEIKRGGGELDYSFLIQSKKSEAFRFPFLPASRFCAEALLRGTHPTGPELR